MRIGLVAPVWFPVPPTGYGGIEWVVWLLADALVDAGHDVTLFATGESRTRARLRYVYEEAPSSEIGQSKPDVRHVLHCFSRQDEFDLINDHSGLVAAMAAGGLRVPFLHTVHGPLDGVEGRLYEQLAALAPDVGLISISLNQRRPKPELNWIANCPNALDFDHYPFVPHRGDYLVFLGRMSPEKGAHRAVRVAIETGLPLKIAGKKREPLEHRYFDEFVRPHLNSRIEYLGEVSHGEKAELLQNARVTLFPIEWEEPFGLVMIESMACGTPVVATRCGAVPEVVEPGRSGVIVDDWNRAAEAIEQADAISPEQCRAYAEEHFARERLVRDYLAAYEAAIASHRSQYRRSPSQDIAKLKTVE
jgi:glycosyltransferase involved in cell wall biosynthesis